MKWLANWIMNRIVGQGSSDWAQAMRSEYDALANGHLTWAIGCTSSLALRELRLNWGLFAAIFVSVILIVAAYPWLIFKLAEYDKEFFRANFYMIFVVAPIPFAFALGAWRPDRKLTIALLGGLVGQGMGNTLVASVMLGGSFFSWFFTAMWMDTLPIYQASVVIALIWYAGAWLGATIRTRFVRPYRA